ncbi:HEAT repeat domain-containing protein [Chlamydiota bacterium]
MITFLLETVIRYKKKLLAKKTILKLLIFSFLLHVNFVAALETYEKLLSDSLSPDPKVRSNACIELGVYSDNETIDVLKSLLRDSTQLVRHSAALALTNIGGEAVEHIFDEMIQTESIERMRVAAVGLGNIGADDASMVTIEQLLGHDNWNVRWAACFALKQIGDERVIENLQNIAQNDPYKKKKGIFPIRILAQDAISDIRSQVRWYGTFLGGLANAQKTKRTIILIFYQNHSKWSEILFKKTFTDKRVISSCKQFACIKINAKMQKKQVYHYGVKQTPHVLFLNQNGDYIDQMTGFVLPDELLKKMHEISTINQDLNSLIRLYKSNKLSISFMMHLANRYVNRDDYEGAIPVLLTITEKKGEDEDRFVAEALFLLGFIFGKQNNYEKSVQFLSQLIYKFPRFYNIQKARYCLALGHLALNNEKDALIELHFLLDSKNNELKKSAQQIIEKIRNGFK